jgi:hypothetical protein
MNKEEIIQFRSARQQEIESGLQADAVAAAAAHRRETARGTAVVGMGQETRSTYRHTLSKNIHKVLSTLIEAPANEPIVGEVQRTEPYPGIDQFTRQLKLPSLGTFQVSHFAHPSNPSYSLFWKYAADDRMYGGSRSDGDVIDVHTNNIEKEPASADASRVEKAEDSLETLRAICEEAGVAVELD